MARSPKSTVLLASLVAWIGIILTALILIYLPHGPARHPKLNAIAIFPMAISQLMALANNAYRRSVIIAQLVLWVVALVTTVLVANSNYGVGLHPLTCPAIYVLLGGVSLGILSATRINEAGA